MRADTKSDSGKALILSRALSRNNLKKGDHVKIKGSPESGTITQIHSSIEDVVWTGMFPGFIEVQLNGSGEHLMLHYSQIKRTGRR